MKSWIIPVTWSVCSTVTIEAETLEEAMKKARNDYISLPQYPEYIDGSWEISADNVEDIRSCYNGNQEDEIMSTSATGTKHSQECEDKKNYSERQLMDRFDDITNIASFLAHIKNEEQTEPKPCKGYDHCWYYGDWDCDSCVAANKIYEYFEGKKKPAVVVKKED